MLVRRFDHVVTGLFFGHVHTDEWTLMRDCDVADPSNWTAVQHCDGKAHTLLLPGVSLTEGFPATNPALRLLEFDAGGIDGLLHVADLVQFGLLLL